RGGPRSLADRRRGALRGPARRRGTLDARLLPRATRRQLRDPHGGADRLHHPYGRDRGRADGADEYQPYAAGAHSLRGVCAGLPWFGHAPLPERRRVSRDRRRLCGESAADRRLGQKAIGQGADRRNDDDAVLRAEIRLRAGETCGGACRRRVRRSPAQRSRRPIMPRTKPPFRADHVGSLLRPAALKAARGKRERGEITAAELTAIEDREIERAIRKQEEIGLLSVTDGEFRRAFWNYDFLGKLSGVEAYLGERKIKFQGPQPKPMMLRVIGKLGAQRAHPMIEHFKFVAAHAKATPKMTIPSPSSLHCRYGRDAVPASIYPAMEDFYRDLGASYRAVVRAFADAGCRYLQLDEVNFAYLCDPKLRAFVAERGDDPQMLPHIYARMINAAISDVPADMTKAMHLCRGNFQSSFVA